MKYPFICAALLTSFLSQVSGAAEQELGRTWAKLDQGKPLVVGYFGGSITAGAGASSPTLCWASLTTAWFKEHFPKATITAVNSSIGGTGSDLGAFRLKSGLLDKHPDLVFVEFAVNDATAPPSRASYYEGVVRQILKANPATDIVLVYTTAKSAETYTQGTVPPAVAAEQQIADHYGLPSVNVGKVLWQTIHDGKGTWETLTRDGTHPNDAGYKIYADTIADFLQSHRKDVAAPPPPLPVALNPNPAEAASLVDASQLAMPGWTKESMTIPQIAGRIPRTLSASTPGTTLTFPFHGSGIGLWWAVTPDSGTVEYAVDNAPSKNLTLWDSYAPRTNFNVLVDDLPVGDHVLHLKISATAPPDSKGTAAHLGYFMVK
jgi:lysophospholipase L1-like esterase